MTYVTPPWHPAFFIRGQAFVGAPLTYTVPAGTRAIITQCSGGAQAGTTGDQYLVLDVAGFPFWIQTIGVSAPAWEPIQVGIPFIVANEGDTINVTVNAPLGADASTASMYIGGYLLPN